MIIGARAKRVSKCVAAHADDAIGGGELRYPTGRITGIGPGACVSSLREHAIKLP